MISSPKVSIQGEANGKCLHCLLKIDRIRYIKWLLVDDVWKTWLSERTTYPSRSMKQVENDMTEEGRVLGLLNPDYEVS
jgi:hypothetical protein